MPDNTRTPLTTPNLPPKVVEMAKKKLLPPARNTQAPRKRKQTPPKPKGQLVKSKGRWGARL